MAIALSPSRGYKRQTVIHGPSTFSVNTYAATLLSATGLVATANSATTPALISFAAGFGPRGAIDYLVRRNAIDTVALAPNTTNYIYYDRNPSTGILSLGAATLPPVYGQYPTTTTAGTVWFSTVDFVMRVSAGSTWQPIQRVYVGEIATNASAPTAVRTYAYNGLYTSPPRPVVGQTAYTFEHNLGLGIPDITIDVYSLGANGIGGASVQHGHFAFGATTYGYLGLAPTRNAYVVTTSANPAIGAAPGQWDTSGTYWLRAERAF
jgi:hypothetical protein